MKNFKKSTLLMALAAIATLSVCASQEILFPQPKMVNNIFRTAQELNKFIPKEVVTSKVALAVGQASDSKTDTPVDQTVSVAKDTSVGDSIESTMSVINNVLALKSFYDLSVNALSVTKAATVFVSTQAQACLATAVTATTYLPTVQQVAIFAAAHPGLIPFVGIVILTTALLRNKDVALKAENAGKEDAISTVAEAQEDAIAPV